MLAVSAKAGIPEGEYRVARSYLEGAGIVRLAQWRARGGCNGPRRMGSLKLNPCSPPCAFNGLIKDITPLRRGAASTGERPTDVVEAEATQAKSLSAFALCWAQRAAREDTGKGQALLGYVLTNGPEPMRDLDDARRWYWRASAKSAVPRRKFGLRAGADAARREGRLRLAAHTNAFGKAAADAGLPTALYVLGALTEKAPGSGGPRSDQPRARSYQHATEKGNYVRPV